MDAFKVKKEAPKTEPCIIDSDIRSHAGHVILFVIFAIIKRGTNHVKN
jgi:hypothetical protein